MKDGLRGLISKDKLFETNKKELLAESQETVKELQCFKDLDNKSFKECEIKLKEKLLSLIEAKDVEAAKAALLNATSVIDKATKKGVYHKNYASRKISRLNLAVNKMN